MKYLIRYLSLSLCCVLLLVAFSVTASAEQITKTYNMYVQSSGLYSGDFTKTIYPNVSEDGYQQYTSGYTIATVMNYYITFYIGYDDTSNIVKKGKNVNVSIENFYHYWRHFSNSTGVSYEGYSPTSVSGYAIYTDGTVEYFDVEMTPKGHFYDISFNVKAEKDILKFAITNTVEYRGPMAAGVGIENHIGPLGEENTHILIIDEVDEKVGLLEKIFGGIKDGFSNIGNKISSVVDGILDLPSKIWSFIENGLKSLFVPSEDYIVGFKGDMDALLSDRLGAVYEVVNILHESWDRISANDKANYITIPETTIDLPQNNEFSFGGVDVQIVPGGFEWLVDIIKMIVGIVCTVLFINGLRKKYDEVMGVEQ